MIIDISFIIIIWFLLALVFIAIGFSFQKYFWPTNYNFQSTATAFWLGWGIVIAALQWWHLFLPIDRKALIFFTLVGILCLIDNRQYIIALFRSCLFEYRYFSILVFCFIVMTASFALTSELPYDAGLYHLQYVKWASQYSIIPGLGNVHAVLAHYSSYFLFMAMLKPIASPVAFYYFASGLLISACMVQSLYPFSKLFNSNKVKPLTCCDLMSISFIFVWIFLACKKASTTSPDIPVCLIGFIISIYLNELAFQPLIKADRIKNILIILFLSITGMTLKLSFLFFGACSIIASVLMVFTYEDLNFNDFLKRSISSLFKKEHVKPLIFVLLCLGIVSIWLIRGFIQSGYPAFPSPIGGINVEWKVPAGVAITDSESIKNWARAPDEQSQKYLVHQHWLSPWIKSIYKYHKHDVVFPLVLFFCGGLSLFFLYQKLILSYGRARPFLFFLPSLLSLLTWFILAPEPRFSGASFLILGIGMIAMLLSLAPFKWQRRYIAAIFLCSFLLGMCFLAFYMTHKFGFQKRYFIPTAQVEKRITDSGLLVYVPVNNDQCWNAPLPCTPGFNSKLTLRNKQDIQGGFKVK